MHFFTRISAQRRNTLNRTSDVVHSLVSWLDRSVGSIKSVAISPDGKIIASGGNNAGDNGVFNSPIKLWDVNTGRAIPTLIEQSGTVYSVAFSPNSKILASGDDENKIKIWNVKTGELIQTLEHYGKVNSVIFSPDGKTLVSGSDDATIKIWHIDY
ncbi:WD40 repeat-containing protein [Crinalium epipsammum PCC 9333]|uniref:WD40 repeat-containing protein n=1 Tax=Crinalium epipsammum PCC 9333 TaxID=1173022 RepID=K9VU03_9CYAN|nr:WD40 repeat-containing protein [Crinalium epipsammum]AFZ11441.1 WD40 repeat-containing protein [Crinalium epipsammum PCC 9333]